MKSGLEQLVEQMGECLSAFTQHDIDSDSYNRGWAYCLEEWRDKLRALLAAEQSNRPAVSCREADLVDWKNHKEEFQAWFANKEQATKPVSDGLAVAPCEIGDGSYPHVIPGKGVACETDIKKCPGIANNTVYGYCPKCGGVVINRERRTDGNDTCTNGHKFPSKEVLANKPAEDKGLWEELRGFVSRRYPLYDGCDAAIEIREILHRHRPAVNEEPLEELAKRKGHRLELAGWLYRPDGGLVVQRAENMVALRAYLNGLPDVKREGK